MSQSYVEAQTSSSRPTHRPQSAAQAREQHAGSVQRKVAATLPGLAHAIDPHRFGYALWSSVLLLVAGCALLYRSPSPDGKVWYLLGGGCVIGAAVLFRVARAGLIARFESESKQSGLNDGAAHVRAHVLFDQVLVPKTRYAPVTDEGSDPAQQVLDRVPLA